MHFCLQLRVNTRRKSQDFKYLDILTSIGLNLDLVSFRVAFLMRCKSSWLTEMQLAFTIECNNNLPQIPMTVKKLVR